MKRTFFFLFCSLFILGIPAAFGAKENFERSKPHVNVGTIGHVDHGKTTLTASLAGAAKRPLLSSEVKYEDIDGTGRVRMDALLTKIRTNHPQYWIRDLDPEDTIKNMVLGAVVQDGAILVVSAADGPTPQTREHILLARRVGVPAIVVFLNSDGVDDPELLRIAGENVRRLLAASGYDGEIPIVTGSVMAAWRGEEDGLVALAELMDALDKFVSRPTKPADKPFLMPIEDVFSIPGRGTVATGRIETGRISVGDPVDIVGLSDRTGADTIAFILMEGEGEVDEADAGDNVGLLLRGIEKSDIRRGQVLAKPGSIKPHRQLRAQIYVLTAEEGGGRAPFFSGYRPQFYFRTTDVTGEIQLPLPEDLIEPGDSGEIKVDLLVPVAINKGLKFAIREGGRTVGAGQVTEIVE